jgi:NAD(P)-dependent dehydrogenase (short-subunit alcohol dehydrogenase family)
MFELTGRRALVTGGGQGVGAGIVRVLAAAGAEVGVNDLHAERAEAVAAEVVAAGGRAVAVPFDVTDRVAVASAIAAFGDVDILVNNAGIPETMRPTQFRDFAPEDWDPYVQVNLYGVLHCTKAVVDGMVERGFGRVITISSGAGIVGLNIGVSLYGAGKGGALAFMRHLAVELGRTGVTANSIALGLMEMKPGADRSVTEAMARQVPKGRLGTGTDAGHLCAFLASDEASWLTGQTIQLNGGSVTT